ncbi:UNVERIFIED_CONTAM: putative ribonuclease H protein, partial [Sesamum calycinum]
MPTQKSQLILSRSAQPMREHLLAALQFQEGHLPLRYLGLPLLASRLSISDCQPLLLKIDSRIKGWDSIQLSFAGRLQLIKSVLMSLNVYWAMAFILPKGIIRAVEKRMRHFLWKGNSAVGYPKVAWSAVCRPVEEGGLGIRDILALNKALMSRHLWKVIQRNQSSIWVQWITHTHLRHKTVWTVDVKGGSWGWRKLLRLRSALLPYIEFKVAAVTLWRGGEFTTTVAYGIFRTPGPMVGWYPLLSGPCKIPRFSFVLWLAILGKLSTMDKPWLSHLGGILSEVYPRLEGGNSFLLAEPCMGEDITWASTRWKGRHIVQAAYRAYYQLLFIIFGGNVTKEFFSTLSARAPLLLQLRACGNILSGEHEEDFNPSDNDFRQKQGALNPVQPVMESAGSEANSMCKTSAPVLSKGKELLLYNSYGALDIDRMKVNVQRARRNLLLNWSWFDDYAGGRMASLESLEVGVDIKSESVRSRAFNKRLHTKCLITVLYGDYDLIPRRNLWRALCNLSAITLNDPWLVLGDFNAVVDDSEVLGRAADTSVSMTEFRNCIRDSGLVQLPFTGCPFTWHNCSEGPRSLWKRLDRMLANTIWMDAWPSSSYVSALPSTSDHSPLILTGMDRGEEHVVFRFDNYLAHLPGFLNSVEDIWKHRIAGTAMYETV